MTDVLTAGLILVAAALGVLFLEVVLDHAVRPAALAPADHPVFGLVAAGRVRGAADRPAAGPPGQRVLRGQDDRGGRPRVQEQPDQLPRPASGIATSISKAAMAAIEAKAVKRPDAGRGRHRRQPAPVMQMAYALSAVVVRLLPLRRADAQEHPRLGPARLPGRRRPADQHAADRHQAGRRPRAVEVVAGSHVPFAVEVQGVRPGKVMLHYSVDGGKFFAVTEFAPARTTTTPGRPRSATSSRASTTT